MKIQVKRLDGGKWVPVAAGDMMGTSIAKYMRDSQAPVVAAVLENDKPALFISNDDRWVAKYKESAMSMHVDTLMELVGTEVFPKISLDMIEQSDIIGIKILNREEVK